MARLDEARVERLGAAFKALRKAGLVARQGFMCCNGCAGSQLATEAGERRAKGLPDRKGCVFFTRQDRDGMDSRTAPGVWLSYGQLHAGGQEIGLPTAEVGKLVVAALEAEGLTVEWDGNPSLRIWVDLQWKPALEPMAVGL